MSLLTFCKCFCFVFKGPLSSIIIVLLTGAKILPCTPLLVTLPHRTLNYGNQKFMVVEPFVYCYKEHLALNVYSLPWLALLWFGKASCFRAAGNKKDPMSPASRHVKNSVSLSHFPNRCQLHSGKVPFRPEIVGCIVSKRHRRGGSFPLEYCMCVCLCMHVHGSLCL